MTLVIDEHVHDPLEGHHEPERHDGVAQSILLEETGRWVSS